MPKFKIDNKADIPAALKDEYEERDGAFYLKIDGGEDVSGLKASNAKLLAEKKKLQGILDAAEQAKQQAIEDKARAEGDVATLEKSWSERNARETKALQAKLDANEHKVKQAAINTTVTTLAAKLSTTPTLLTPYLKSRLKVEIGEDGEALVRVLDENGRISANSVNDLEKEVLANKEFAPIIRVSIATGGGAGSGGSNGGNAGRAASGAKKIFDMTLAEKRALYDADPAEYKRRAAAAEADNL